MKNLMMTDNLIDIVFNDCDKAILDQHRSIDSNYTVDKHTIHVSTMATAWKHQSYDNQPLYTDEQMLEIFKYVITEMKQLAIREIRSGISDIILTVESISSNPKYYKQLQHSIIKYGYEFEIFITIHLI